MKIAPPKKIKTKLSRKGITFIACIVIASLMWVVSALSKEYVVAVNFPVKFNHLPKDKMVANHLPDEIELELKTSGFILLGFKMGRGPDTLHINAGAMRLLHVNDYYLAMAPKMDKMAKQLGRTVKIVKVNPDTVYFNFNAKTGKVVPVKLNTAISFEKEYQLNGNIVITPAEVKVSGPSSVIEKIKQLETEPVKLEKLNKETQLAVKLKPAPGLYPADLSVSEVNVKIPVARYTEGSITLPVQIINVPSRKRIKLFPDKVTVKYLVAFDEYENIKPELFKVTADYARVKGEKGNKMKVEVTSLSNKVKQLKALPAKVEYIIIK